jgi:hypothetical protein
MYPLCGAPEPPPFGRVFDASAGQTRDATIGQSVLPKACEQPAWMAGGDKKRPDPWRAGASQQGSLRATFRGALRLRKMTAVQTQGASLRPTPFASIRLSLFADGLRAYSGTTQAPPKPPVGGPQRTTFGPLVWCDTEASVALCAPAIA